jgi:hypothetical protein
VRLDYTMGPILPLGRSAVIEGAIPPSDRIEIELVLDGAAVFGTVNGRPLAYLVFADGLHRDGISLQAEGGAHIARLRFAGRSEE